MNSLDQILDDLIGPEVGTGHVRSAVVDLVKADLEMLGSVDHGLRPLVAILVRRHFALVASELGMKVDPPVVPDHELN